MPADMAALRTAIEFAVHEQKRDLLAACERGLAQPLSCWQRLELRSDGVAFAVLGHATRRCRAAHIDQPVDDAGLAAAATCIEQALGAIEPIGVPLMLPAELTRYTGELDINLVLIPPAR